MSIQIEKRPAADVSVPYLNERPLKSRPWAAEVQGVALPKGGSSLMRRIIAAAAALAALVLGGGAGISGY